MVVCKADNHKGTATLRGYIAMLVVMTAYRGLGVGERSPPASDYLLGHSHDSQAHAASGCTAELRLCMASLDILNRPMTPLQGPEDVQHSHGIGTAAHRAGAGLQVLLTRTSYGAIQTFPMSSWSCSQKQNWMQGQYRRSLAASERCQRCRDRPQGCHCCIRGLVPGA